MTLRKKGRSRPRAVIRECPLWVDSCRSRRAHCAGQIRCKQLVKSNANG
ncbi:hypothetical protein ALQ58_200424 [Pseudomonas syringae pv. apii]|nr:hypothetical protein ALQ58_200424 [Pseudomonas syringae pv. apii]